jgi:hypothetical protein
MQQDRLSRLLDDLVDGPEVRLVERRPVHVGMELDGVGAGGKRALGFARRRLRRVHRQ